MLIIVDKKIPEEAKFNLMKFGELMQLETAGITYPAIAGHPDIFFTQIDDRLVVAPNLPFGFIESLKKNNIKYQPGNNLVGTTYPDTARYNAVITAKYLVHNTKITDAQILKLCEGKTRIHTNQGYSRCNLIFLDENHTITSDAGIAKQLSGKGIETLLVNPDGIMLPGFNHGFFGGCCGVLDQKLFVLGNPDKFPDGERVRSFAAAAGFQIIDLCDTPLFDGGGVFFIS